MSNKKKKNQKQPDEAIVDAPIIQEAIPIERLTLIPKKETSAKGFDFVSTLHFTQLLFHRMQSSSKLTSSSTSYHQDTPKAKSQDLKKARPSL